MAEEIKELIEDDASAFNDAVRDLFEEDDTSEEDTEVKSDVEDNEDEPADVDTSADDVTDGQEPAQQQSTDYEALYKQAAANNAAMQQDLANYEQKLRSWDGRIEAVRKETEDAIMAKINKQVEPEIEENDPDLEDVLEMYPDLIPQVQKLIDNKVTKEVSGVEDRVAQLIEQHVSPIATRVQDTEDKAHEAAILEAHPDIREHIASGAFKQWVDSLSPYQQVGAQQICDRGTAEEVIDLFTNFKKATNAEVPPKSQTKKKSSATTVDKLKDAMSVPSTPTKVNLEGQEEDMNKLFAAATREIMQEEQM